MLVKVFERKLLATKVPAGTFPGILDFDYVVESDTDGYDPSGRLIFKFRRNVIDQAVNERFPAIADICRKTQSLRTNAAGPQIYEDSRIIGFSIDRFERYARETDYTSKNHAGYKKLIPLVEAVDRLYRSEFPQQYYYQRALDIDPHFQIGTSIFNQGIINKSFRTALHLDRGNIPGTMSNLICLGNESYIGGSLIFPEYRIAIDLRPRDYIGFLGQEIWHGNSEISGQGIRLSLVFYAKKEFIGRTYDDELRKMAVCILRSSVGS